MEKRGYIPFYKDVLHRYILWHSSLGNRENIYLAEFPKSGGTWLAQMLSELIDLPFPRNAPIESQPCILHGHHQIVPKQKKVIHLVRDGRDVMVSAYHHFLLNNQSIENKSWSTKMGNEDLQDVSRHLPKFIGLFWKRYKSGLTHKNWSDFVSFYWNHDTVYNLKYEDLNRRTEKTLLALMEYMNEKVDNRSLKFVIDKYSFETQTSQLNEEGTKNLFLRKGIVGDWKNYFNREAAEVFNFYAGDTLVLCGYEENKNWYR